MIVLKSSVHSSAGGAPPVLESWSTSDRGIDTTPDVTYPSGIQENDILIAHLYADTDNVKGAGASGFGTIVAWSASFPGVQNYIGWKRATGSESGTEAFSSESGFTMWIMLRFSGCIETGDPFEAVEDGQQTTNLTTISPPNTLTANSLAVTLWAWQGGEARTLTAPSGAVEEYDDQVQAYARRMACATKEMPETGDPGDFTFTGTARNGNASAFALIGK